MPISINDQPWKEATEIALEAGRTALGYFNRAGLRVGIKADQSLLTEADASTEELIVQRLATRFHNEPVIGEETIAAQTPETFAGALQAPSAWVVDPIDGTNNFVAGDPLWCVAIARLEQGRPTLGVIYFPAWDGQLFYNESDTLFLRRHASVGGSSVEVIPADLPAKCQSPLFMAYDSFYMKFSLNRPHVPRISGCTVLNVLYVMIGKAFGAATSAHLWDFAAPLAFGPSRGVRLAAAFREHDFSTFRPQDLHLSPDPPKKAWKIKEECFVGTSERLAELRRAISALK